MSLKRLLPGLALLLAAGAGACQWLLPERFAVNAPLANMLFGSGVSAPAEATVAARIRAPAGFQVVVWADGVDNARTLRFTAAGDLLVSQPRRGQVRVLFRDADGDGRSDGSAVLLDGLDRPYGLDLRDGWLYVATGSEVFRVRFDEQARRTSGEPERIVSGLPSGGNHWSRSLRFGPDGALYVSVGSSCNVCQESDPRRAALLRYAADGSGEEIVATGLRNSVGFDWRPGTGELYATDNGRDLLGDDFPPCELNRIVPGGFYGWPVANGDNVPDPDLGAGQEERIARAIPPVHGFRAHNAPLGMTFVRGAAAEHGYRDAALVALHGSWNRTRKDGYKVVSLHWAPDGSISERDFLVGFEREGDVIGRPVDVAEGPDGAIYVSDDYAGAIYRVAIAGAGSGAAAPVRAVAPAPAAPDPVRAARGAALYERHDCAGCHEAERAAPGVVPVVLTGLSTRYSDEQLAALLAVPTPPMPVAPLAAEERLDLAAWLRTARP